MLLQSLSFVVSFLLVVSFAGADPVPVIELPPLIRDGTPADAMLEDPLVPGQSVPASPLEAGGRSARALGDRIPLPVVEPGTSGDFSQFRGHGRSVEDTNVQSLGIPLNYPQGGGFDFSAVPSYLWSEYRFQSGPSLGSADPRGVAGTLTLVPRTLAALERPGSGRRATALFSESKALELSGASWKQGSHAALAGYSFGDTRGPAAAFSGQWEGPGGSRIKAHFLGTRIDASTPGPRSFRDPLARQVTARLRPVLQADFDVGGSGLLKTSVYYDWLYIRSDRPSPPFPFFTRDRARQGGGQVFYIQDQWRVGAGHRRVSYELTGYASPLETVSHGTLSRRIELSPGLELEPELAPMHVSGYGFLPQGSLGARRDFAGLGSSIYGRASYSRRVPSLADRYYQAPFFSPNPDLRPERDWTLVVGTETRAGPWFASIESFNQWREEAQIARFQGFTTQVVNTGSARIGTVILGTGWKDEGLLEVRNALAMSRSKVEATGFEFPYHPRWTDTLRIEARPARGSPFLLAVAGRFASSATYSDAGSRLPGYGYFDVQAQAQLNGIIEGIEGSFEVGALNITDRPVEVYFDYPLERVIFTGVSAYF